MCHMNVKISVYAKYWMYFFIYLFIGLLQFTQAIQTMKKENSEVLQMSEDLKQLLLPPLSLPYAQVSSSWK